MGKKVFIIGLDGATWKLIEPLVKKGKLPTMKKLLNNGCSSVLNSTLLPISPAAWTTFATGVDPDKHGVLDFSHRKKGTYESVPFTALDRKHPTLWNYLGRAGKKSIVLNVPGTYPVEDVNGLMVSGFPTPEELNDFTHPPNLLDELRARFGSDFHFQPKVNAQHLSPFLDEMHVVTDNVYRATRYLMKKYPWDLFATVFVGPDALGHVFYRFMDPNHPLYEKNAPARFKNAVADIYERIDGYMAKLMAELDEDTTVMLMSDHGFGPMYYGVSINNWLMDKGFLHLKRRLSTRLRYFLFKRGVNFSNLFRLIVFFRLTQKASRAAYSRKTGIKDLVEKFFLSNKDIDWDRTTAYSMGNHGQIFVNLRGREPMGNVNSGRDYEKIVKRVSLELSRLRDPVNGKVIFDRVLTKKEAFPSSAPGDDLPDLVFFDTDMKYIINRFFSFGSKHLISKHPVWNGTHTHDGIFLVHDRKLVREGVRLEEKNIRDVAPTVLDLMGFGVPDIMDGQPVREIYRKGAGTCVKNHRLVDGENGQEGNDETEKIRKNIQLLKGLNQI